MATSFLAPNSARTFSPYISQYNPELYARIIGSKQADYEQGVATLQNYVDNVTGLQVGREEDAQYLRDKITDLKNKIDQSGRNADYANPNFNRQLGVYMSQVWNDDRIKKDVLSNLNAKDAMNQLDQAKKDGTYNDANADLLYENINNWRKGGASASLGKQSYIPYDDGVADRFQKFMKDVHGNIMFSQDSVTDKDGNIVPYVITNNQREYISADTIKNSWNTFLALDGKARTQINIDSRYNAKMLPDDTVRDYITRNYNEQNASLDQQIDFYNKQKVLQNARPDLVAKYDASLKDLLNKKNQLPIQQQEDLKLLTTDPLSLKSRIYSQRLTEGLVSRYGRDNTKSQMSINPAWQAQLQEKNYQLKVDALNQKKAMDEATIRLREQQYMAKLAGKTNAGAGEHDFNQTAISADQSINNATELDQQLVTMGQVVDGEMNKFVYDFYKTQNNGVAQSVQNLIIKNGNNYIINPNAPGSIDDKKKQITALMQSAYQAYGSGDVSGLSKAYAQQYFGNPYDVNYGYGRYKNWMNMSATWSKKLADIHDNSVADLLTQQGIPREDWDKPFGENARMPKNYDYWKYNNGEAKTVTPRELASYYLEVQDHPLLGSIAPGQINFKGISSDRASVITRYANDLLNELPKIGNGKELSNASVEGLVKTYNSNLDKRNVAAKEIASATALPNAVFSDGSKNFDQALGMVRDSYIALQKMDGKDKNGEDFNSVITAARKGKGSFGFNVTYNPITNKFQANFQGADLKPVQLTQQTALKLAPEFSTLFNPNALIRNEIQRSDNNSTDTELIPTSQLKNYSLRVHYEGADRLGELVAPVIEWKDKRDGASDWKEIPQLSSQFSTLDANIDVVNLLSDINDDTFEKEIISK